MEVPVHPCGRSVDWVRDPYLASLKPWLDSDEEVLVRWFPAPEGAGHVGGVSVYRSSYWYDPNWFVPPVGEHGPRTYGPGLDQNPAGLTGRGGSCGTPEAWLSGGLRSRDPVITTDENGAAPCCTLANMVASGGVQQGRARFELMRATGGQQQWGYAWMGLAGYMPARGGLMQGGRARLRVPVIQTGAGGQRQGGAARLRVPVIQRGAGGVRQGGVAPVPLPVLLTARGGLRQGGLAQVLVPVVQTAGGGLRQGGLAQVLVPVVQTAGGGLRQGGVGVLHPVPLWLAAGGSEQGGVAIITTPVSPPSVRSSKHGNNLSGNTYISKPTGTADGDLVVVCVSVINTGMTFFPSLEGFSSLFTVAYGTNAALVYAYKVASGEPMSWLLSGMTGTTWSYAVASVKGTSGVDNTGSPATGGIGAYSLPSVTTSGASRLLLALLTEGGNATPSDPAGMTLVDNGGLGPPRAYIWSQVVGSGATGTRSGTVLTSNGWGGLLIAAAP